MNPAEFLDALESLRATIKRSKSRTVSSQDERNLVRSFVGAWFSTYRPIFQVHVDDTDLFAPIDELMEALYKCSSQHTARITYKRISGQADKYFREALLVPLSRAYWSQAPTKAPSGRDAEVARRLALLDPQLANSYEQVVVDLADDTRSTFKGPAGELREILRAVLHQLAPTAEVQKEEWWKESRKTSKDERPPTQSERTKYLLRKRRAGSAAEEAAESYLLDVEERLGRVVRASYNRASAATHAGADRREVLLQLKYVNALLTELLPLESER